MMEGLSMGRNYEIWEGCTRSLQFNLDFGYLAFAVGSWKAKPVFFFKMFMMR